MIIKNKTTIGRRYASSISSNSLVTSNSLVRVGSRESTMPSIDSRLSTWHHGRPADNYIEKGDFIDPVLPIITPHEISREPVSPLEAKIATLQIIKRRCYKEIDDIAINNKLIKSSCRSLDTEVSVTEKEITRFSRETDSAQDSAYGDNSSSSSYSDSSGNLSFNNNNAVATTSNAEGTIDNTMDITDNANSPSDTEIRDVSEGSGDHNSSSGDEMMDYSSDSSDIEGTTEYSNYIINYTTPSSTRHEFENDILGFIYDSLDKIEYTKLLHSIIETLEHNIMFFATDYEMNSREIAEGISSSIHYLSFIG